MRLWSPARLRNSVDDWEEITPEPLRKAVAALRRKFATSAWKVDVIMRQGCHPALHKGMADQARTINEGLMKLGFPSLPTVDEGAEEPSVFGAYFDRSAGLLAREVQSTFSEVLGISLAQSGVLGRDPVEWATVETKLMIADESYGIPLWTRWACDVQPYDTNDRDESIYWRKWRAPHWFFMKPFANMPYDRATAWDRMDEAESKDLLEEVEDRFNHRLIMALDKAVDDTHIRLAKQAPQITPTVTPLETSASTTKGEPAGAMTWRRGPEAQTDQPRTWQEIEIAFLSDERIEICCKGVRETRNYAEFGLADKRNGRPGRAWVTLREMASHNGILPQPPAGKNRAMIEKRVGEIRKTLRTYFNIDSDPIPFNGGYQASFKITRRPSFDS